MFARIFEYQGNQLLTTGFMATTEERAGIDVDDGAYTAADFAKDHGLTDTGRFLEFSFGQAVPNRRIEFFPAGDPESIAMLCIAGPVLEHGASAIWVDGQPEAIPVPEVRL